MSGSRKRRRTGSTARRYKPSELVPVDPRRQVSKEAVLTAIAVSIVMAMLTALIWIMTQSAVQDQQTALRDQVERMMTAQAATLAEAARLEILMVDQSLTILQAAANKDPENFKLSEWHNLMPALTSVADDIFIADGARIIQQDVLPQAVGQGIGAAYLNIPHGSLEDFESDGSKGREGRMITPTTAPGVQARRFLMYVVRPLEVPAQWVIGASYRSGELTRIYADSKLGPNGLAALMDTRRGGVQSIAGDPSRRPKIDVSKSEMYEAFKRGDGGVWTGPSGMDGVERIHGYRKVPGRDMVVTVATTRAYAMAPADTLASGAYSLAAAATALVGVIGGVALWGLARRRAMRRQQRLFQRNKVEADAALADLTTSRTRGFITAGQVRALLDGSADGIALLDNDLRLSSWNQRFVAGAGLEETTVQEGLPLDQLLRLQAHAGLFGPLADVEAEVSRRLGLLRSAGPEQGLTQLGPDGTPIAVRADRIPDIGLALHLGGLADWKPMPRPVQQPVPVEIEPVADIDPNAPNAIKEKTAPIEW